MPEQATSSSFSLTPANLWRRTKKFAGLIISFVEGLPRSLAGDVIGRQLIRSATPVAANYRAAGRARSNADFSNKLGIVEEEADESLFWIEMLLEAKKVEPDSVVSLMKEADELVAIFSAAHKSAKLRLKKR